MELHRREFAALLIGAAASAGLAGTAEAQSDPLPSWNDGPAKEAILKFVRATTDSSGPDFVPPPERIATFDQDGTLWVEHPMYTQVVYCFDRVPAIVKTKPELAGVEAFKTVLTGDLEAIAKLRLEALEKIDCGDADRHGRGRVHRRGRGLDRGRARRPLEAVLH
jgi:hypothetical protein